jgi:hypothetical protein
MAGQIIKQGRAAAGGRAPARIETGRNVGPRERGGIERERERERDGEMEISGRFLGRRGGGRVHRIEGIASVKFRDHQYY